MLQLDFSPGAADLVELWIDSNESGSDYFRLLAKLVDGWIDFASEEFPKTVAKISDCELQFMSKKCKQKRQFIRDWVALHEAVVHCIPDEHEFRYFGSYL